MDIKDIAGLNNIAGMDIGSGVNKSNQEGGLSFGDMLSESINNVNKLQAEADKAIVDIAAGKGTSIHETMIALEKADLSFRLMMQVRNKIVEAYQEIMRMPV